VTREAVAFDGETVAQAASYDLRGAEITALRERLERRLEKGSASDAVHIDVRDDSKSMVAFNTVITVALAGFRNLTVSTTKASVDGFYDPGDRQKAPRTRVLIVPDGDGLRVAIRTTDDCTGIPEAEVVARDHLEDFLGRVCGGRSVPCIENAFVRMGPRFSFSDAMAALAVVRRFSSRGFAWSLSPGAAGSALFVERACGDPLATAADGLRSAEIQTVLDAAMGALRACYGDLLRSGSKPRVTLATDIQISADGSVRTLGRLSNSTQTETSAELCARQVLLNLRFPRPRGREILLPLQYEFSLDSGGQVEMAPASQESTGCPRGTCEP
jgi:hypothetical protein